MEPVEQSEHHVLVERIKSARAALRLAADLDTRNSLLDELGTATKELADLVLRHKGPLKSLD